MKRIPCIDRLSTPKVPNKKAGPAKGRPETVRNLLRHALDDERGRDRALRRETVGVLEVVQGLLELRLVVVVNHHQRLALLDLRTDLLDLRDADSVVDLVVVRGILA